MGGMERSLNLAVGADRVVAMACGNNVPNVATQSTDVMQSWLEFNSPFTMLALPILCLARR